MGNYARKWLKRLSASISLAVIGILCLTLIALAAPGSVTDLVAVPTDTTISLTWTLATDSTSTIIRHSTTEYPATVGAGTSTYNGTGSYTILEDLTAGTRYYFSAWGYDGVDYGAVVNLDMTTQSAVSGNTTIPFDKPVIPTETTQDPDTSGWDIEPIDAIIAYFSDNTSAHGGLGMPADNLIMFMAGVGVTGMGLMSYIKWRSFFSAWFMVLILCAFLSSIEIMQWIVVGFLLLVGWGVWAIDKSNQ